MGFGGLGFRVEVLGFKVFEGLVLRFFGVSRLEALGSPRHPAVMIGFVLGIHSPDPTKLGLAFGGTGDVQGATFCV